MRHYDEGPIAREMAAKVGAEFHPIPIGQDDLADNFADAILQSETFCVNAHGVAKYLLSRAVRDAGYKVVITGEGSDEILGGYAHFRRDMLLYNREGQDPSGDRAAADVAERKQYGVARLAAAGWRGRARWMRCGGFSGYVPSWIETFSSRAVKAQLAVVERFQLPVQASRRLFNYCRRSIVPRPVERTRCAATSRSISGRRQYCRTTS